MIYAVFLCDRNWKIEKIKRCSKVLHLQEGEILSELVSEGDDLPAEGEEHATSVLTFVRDNIALPAIMHLYKEGTLVVLADVSSNQDFLEFNREYLACEEWAKDHLFGLFHNEYYMIQQMNNQLIDVQRRLSRSNSRLEQALSDNKEINKKLEEARNYAERASSSKSNFLASMSHDIRTPMNAIIGFTELMQHNLDKPEVLDRYLKKLRYSSKYLLDLINDILDLSKIENGSLELRIEPMDIGAQIEQVVTIIKPQMAKKKLELTVRGDDADYGFVLGDAVRFRQILMNIFSNAAKYTPEGGHICFEISDSVAAGDERTYRFVIADDGIGMSEEFQKHIFDPFTRSDELSGEIQGTGLGMAITRNIVEAMGGGISVESELGKGSRFSIELTFAICEDGEKADSKDADTLQNALNLAQDTEADNAALSSLKGMRFLCAEDNELNAEILVSFLQLDGAECTVYGDGKQLVEAFAGAAPGDYDAVLMDIEMPVMNGYEAARLLRCGENPLGRTIPIIAMTANAFTEDIMRSKKAGMDAHIAKPIDRGRLCEVLAGCIGKGARRQ